MLRAQSAIGWTAAGAMAAGLALRRLPRDYHRYQVAVEGTRELWLAPAPLLAVTAFARRRPLLGAVFTGLTAELLRSADVAGRSPTEPEPRLSPQERPTGFRLVSANLLIVNRRMAQLARELLADDPDVIVLQELGRSHLAALAAAGVLRRFPHHVLDPRPSWNGSALLSRWAISDARVLEFAGAPMSSADVATPAGPVHVVAVHAMNPAGRHQLVPWGRQHQLLAEHARSRRTPVVLAGDYNATVHHRPMRALLRSGLRDAFTEPGMAADGRTGRMPGTQPRVRLGMTWPRWRWPVRPVMRLDHVLISPELTVDRMYSAISTGSDHLRLVVDLRL